MAQRAETTVDELRIRLLTTLLERLTLHIVRSGRSKKREKTPLPSPVRSPPHLARVAASDELRLDAGDVFEGLLQPQGGDSVEGLQVTPVH